MSDLTGIGSVADLANTVVSRIWPDKTEQEKAQLSAALALVQGQLDINRAEAASPSVFTSGWRPFIGWVCGMACAWNWIGLKLALFFYAAVLHQTLDLQPANLTEMWPVLIGMLGLGSLRSVDKFNGVAK